MTQKKRRYVCSAVFIRLFEGEADEGKDLSRAAEKALWESPEGRKIGALTRKGVIWFSNWHVRELEEREES